MKKLKRLYGIIFVVFTGFLLCVVPVNAALDKEVIRVGFPIQEGMTTLDEDGKRSGYSYDYLEEIAKYTKWEYEFDQILQESKCLLQ